MTLRFLSRFPHSHPFPRRQRWALAFALAVAASIPGGAQAKPGDSGPDVLVLSNGDTLHGKFVSSMQGTVTFHSDVLGDLAVAWDKVKELRTAEKFAVLESGVKVHGRKEETHLPEGKLAVENQSIIIETEGVPAPPPIPTKNALYILDVAVLDKDKNATKGSVPPTFLTWGLPPIIFKGIDPASLGELILTGPP